MIAKSLAVWLLVTPILASTRAGLANQRETRSHISYFALAYSHLVTMVRAKSHYDITLKRTLEHHLKIHV